MQNFKTISIGITIMLIVFMLMYLIGSFCAVSFDIRTWDPLARSLGGVLGGVVSIGLSVAYVLNNYEK